MIIWLSGTVRTLYIDSRVGASQQVVAIEYVDALKSDKRLVISKNTKDKFRNQNGKVYIGEVQDDRLVKIKTTDDLKVIKENPSLITDGKAQLPLIKISVHSLE